MQSFDPADRNRLLFELSVYLHTIIRKLSEDEVAPDVPSKILFVLQIQRQISLKNLCDILGITASAGSILIDKCVKMGLVERQPDSKDRRKVVLSLTEAGTEEIDRCTARLYKNLNDAMTTLSDEENEDLYDALCNLTAYILKAFPYNQRPNETGSKSE